MSQEQVKKFKLRPLFGKEYEITEQEIEKDARATAQRFNGFDKCDTITYGMYPAYRDLSQVADDCYHAEDDGALTIDAFEIWAETFDDEIEKLGFSITGDEGDGTVCWLHVANCKCFESEE